MLSNFAQLVRIPEPLRLPPGGIVLRAVEAEDYAFVVPFEQLSVFARKYETSEALSSMPVYAIASLGDIDAVPTPVPPTEENHDPPPIPVPLVHRPLGLLGTDHVGYASFDLPVLRSGSTLDASRSLTVRAGRRRRSTTGRRASQSRRPHSCARWPNSSGSAWTISTSIPGNEKPPDDSSRRRLARLPLFVAAEAGEVS
jgi:hypothetical protein